MSNSIVVSTAQSGILPDRFPISLHIAPRTIYSQPVSYYTQQHPLQCRLYQQNKQNQLTPRINSYAPAVTQVALTSISSILGSSSVYGWGVARAPDLWPPQPLGVEWRSESTLGGSGRDCQVDLMYSAGM